MIYVRRFDELDTQENQNEYELICKFSPVLFKKPSNIIPFGFVICAGGLLVSLSKVKALVVVGWLAA